MLPNVTPVKLQHANYWQLANIGQKMQGKYSIDVCFVHFVSETRTVVLLKLKTQS